MKHLNVEALEAIGFFRYTGVTDRSRTVSLVRERNFAFAGSDRRLYHADAESLAEHGVRDFLGSVAPFLRHAGVPIEVTYRQVKTAARGGHPARWAAATLTADGWLDEDGPSSFVESMRLSPRPAAAMCDVTEDELEESETYLLFLGDREFVIYDFEPGQKWDGWRAATRSTLALLNELLTAHDSVERAYALSSDNDLCVAFVTPEMARVINDAAPSNQQLHDGESRTRP